MEGTPLRRRDYQGLARQIKAAHHKCRAGLQAGLKHAVDCGRLLLDAKSKIEHGEWIRWLDTQCEISERLAQKYMRVAREFPRLAECDATNTPRVADLSFRQALDLLARNVHTTLGTPQHRREQLLSAAEQQDYLSLYPTQQRLKEDRRLEQSERAREANRELEQHRQQRLCEQEAVRRRQQQERIEEERRLERPFALADLGPLPSEQPVQFTPEGGIAGANHPKPMSRDEISVLREELARLMMWFARLEDRLGMTYRSDDRPAQLAKMCAGNIKGLLRITTEAE